MKVLISDKLAKEGIDILEAVEGLQVDCKYGLSPDELKQVIGEYEGLVIRSGTQVTQEILESAHNLRVIGRAGVGLDNVDLSAATKKGVVAMNTPAGNTTSTAEQTMSMILSLSRNTPQAYASMRAGKWERSKFSGVELNGKVLGVIGFGRIGSTVTKYAKAFGMEVIVYDPFLSVEAAEKKNVMIADLETIYQKADYITLHIPKTTETKGMISDEAFDLMKKTARIVNCARGGIIDENALIRALEEGKIAGCALDVFETEPPDFSSKLFELENCITTPHLGASTSEAQVNVAVEIAETVRDALLGKGIVNAANFPSVNGDTFKTLEPYINLGTRLGKFSGQLVEGGMKEINVTYQGEINQFKVAAVTLSVVNGLLTPILGEEVNYLNALEVAKERGIKVQEIKSTKESEFLNYINIEIVTDKETLTILGVLSANKQPRIAKINGIYIDASPEDNMLFIKNKDKPGLVGAVGTFLAEVNVNIAGISLGREAQDGVAVSVVNIDSQVPDDVVTKLKQTDGVLFVKTLSV